MTQEIHYGDVLIVTPYCEESQANTRIRSAVVEIKEKIDLSVDAKSWVQYGVKLANGMNLVRSREGAWREVFPGPAEECSVLPVIVEIAS